MNMIRHHNILINENILIKGWNVLNMFFHDLAQLIQITR